MEAVGEEAFELGLLMGTESDPMEEEQLQVYCFHHLLLTQFVASKYVATLDAVGVLNKSVKFAVSPPPSYPSEDSAGLFHIVNCL